MFQGNAALAHRYFTEVLGGQVDVADEIVAEDVSFIGPSYWGEILQGREGFKGFIRYLRSAFPDLSFRIEEEIVCGPRIVTWFRMTGTHQGQWLEFAPTGRPIDLPGADIFRVEDGRIAEIRVFYDTLGLLQQLGVVPSPAAASS
jgi:steroid delta-isomerase-like uncharacterized protein